MIRIAVFVASSRVPPTCTRMRPERPSLLRRSAADSWLNDPTTFAVRFGLDELPHPICGGRDLGDCRRRRHGRRLRNTRFGVVGKFWSR